MPTSFVASGNGLFDYLIIKAERRGDSMPTGKKMKLKEIKERDEKRD
jgi:hypothetical protein